MARKVTPVGGSPAVEVQHDYIEPGSDEHAALLGLVKDEKAGWRLADVTAFGPSASERYLAEVLRQKLAELSAKPPEFQTADSRKPNYAPPLWTPPVKRPDEKIVQSSISG